ncbi:MAG: peptide-methionine (S)-S-oxide reductase MsrA [Verrucomicrobiales bacterium]
MIRRSLFTVLLLPFLLLSCQAEEKKTDYKQDQDGVPEGFQTLTLGAGCFWCVEAVYQQIEGVHSAVSGYMGGHIANPTYEQVTSKTSGHVEVVQVVYNPEKLSTEKLLEWFWDLHDPTQADGQGADIGPQYLSTIFYHTEEQKKIAEASKKEAQKKFDKAIATSIKKAKTFYKAEGYHQDFYFLNKNHGYNRAVIAPKLDKLKLEK